MKKTKSVIAVILAIVMALSFAACGSKYAEKNVVKDDGSIEFGKADYSEEKPIEIGTPDKEVDPEKVYKSIEYKPDMFYGQYKITSNKEIYDKDGYVDTKSEKYAEFVNNSNLVVDKKKSNEYSTRKNGTIPIGFASGPTSSFTLSKIKDFEYCKLSLPYCYESKNSDNSYGYQDYYFAFEVAGNKIKLRGFDYDTESDKEQGLKKVEYEFNGFDLEYEFSFKGRDLTLKSGDKSVTLSSCYKADKDIVSFNAYCYLKNGAEKLDGIDYINLERMHDTGNKYYTCFYVYDKATKFNIHYGNARMSDDGLLTFTVKVNDVPKTYQFVYFFGGEEIVLSDGEKTYFYTGSYDDYYGNSFGDNIESGEKEKLGELSKEELEAIDTKKSDLMTDLETEFKNEGIEVSVNRETGELAMDSTVLFGGDSAELSNEGKAFLDKFVKAYTKIIYNEKYNGFIKKTMVEGHIAPVDGVTYEKGLPLSEKRANNVKDYCLSVKDVDTTKLKETIETKGYSQSKPIKDKNGKVDFEASRRVSFRFIINLDKTK